MYIHPEGRNTIIIMSTALAVVIVIALLIPIHVRTKVLMIAPFIFILVMIFWFFRVPDRAVNTNSDMIISPADGKIVVIEKTFEPEYFKDERIQISIFMSPLNVHQNTYPVDGTVTYACYHKGDYLVAWHPKSSTKNERSTIVIKQKNGDEILVRQIAGAVARRICTYSKQGEDVVQGSELGFIKFGSRVDVFLPLSYKVECSLDAKSKNKQTILARIQ